MKQQQLQQTSLDINMRLGFSSQGKRKQGFLFFYFNSKYTKRTFAVTKVDD